MPSKFRIPCTPFFTLARVPFHMMLVALSALLYGVVFGFIKRDVWKLGEALEECWLVDAMSCIFKNPSWHVHWWLAIVITGILSGLIAFAVILARYFIGLYDSISLVLVSHIVTGFCLPSFVDGIAYLCCGLLTQRSYLSELPITVSIGSYSGLGMGVIGCVWLAVALVTVFLHVSIDNRLFTILLTLCPMIVAALIALTLAASDPYLSYRHLTERAQAPARASSLLVMGIVAILMAAMMLLTLTTARQRWRGAATTPLPDAV
ncbi:hypothetical protein GMRT_14532 [Giardia muris]|uniref:Uncharacterized protein n=1 Tax=Giardia muris TaxID=5742 RepID=A0A4Z1ST51_GIAMU|nr:hypothetical protein GMRT_14532 [Giardia muris]|eukprot:TNJ29074.1 hypothetical protein GMRT_14532 [Giardia muris]